MTKLGMNSAQIAKFDPAAGTEVKKVEQEIGQMIELQMMSDYPQLLGYEESFESWLLQYSCPAMAKENLDTHNARKKAEGEHEAHQKELEAISKQKTTSDDL